MVQPITRWVMLLMLLTGAPHTLAEGPEIPAITDLRAEARIMQGQRTPLLLMFYASHCVYCERMEREFLKPMLISGEYTDKVVIRRVRLDPSARLTDFDGQTITGAELAARYNVFVTPTLVFLDSKGAPLAEKMVGLGTPDFFGSYLDAAIDTSVSHFRAGTAVAKQRDPSCNPIC